MKKIINIPLDLFLKAEKLRYKLEMPSFTKFVLEAIEEKIDKETKKK
jgi:hypothetical protein